LPKAFKKSEKPPPATLAEWLGYIESQHPKSIAMGLDRVDQVRLRLQLAPDFPIITVGGTNGKGSTCAILESIYHKAGYKVGCYTSPHLLRYNERLRIDCTEADDGALCAAFHAVELAREDVQLTYFEFGTLAAVWHLVQSEVDVGILEVGLGGRLDAVNVFEPSCCIVTNVGLDHMDFLGNSREDIGYEKSGIFRRNIPAICGDLHPPDRLRDHASFIGADLKLIQRDFTMMLEGDVWTYWNEGSVIEGLSLPALTGNFQLNNAACAITAINALHERLPVNNFHLSNGLHTVRLAGRFQKVGEHPQVILDVAHNPHAALVLAENLQQSHCGGDTTAVFAMLADKDIEGVVNAVAGQVNHWYIGGIDNTRAASVQKLAQTVAKHDAGNGVKIFPDIASAYHQAYLDAGKNDRIIVFGSFYTVADVMRVLAPTHPND
jgi:dihydrofolate synthase/folylpolyglutamate synthase